jgi:hypothetical protein
MSAVWFYKADFKSFEMKLNVKHSVTTTMKTTVIVFHFSQWRPGARGPQVPVHVSQTRTIIESISN